MPIKITQDPEQQIKLNSESPDVNNKYIGSIDKKDSISTARATLHNDIHNSFIECVKNNKIMSDAYFKAALGAVYNDIYKTSLVWKNIPIEADVQIGIKKILKDTSYAKVYDILKYYSEDAGKGMIDSTDLVGVTGMFYAALYLFVKREMTV